MAGILEDQEDAYGHEILDFLERREGKEIIEREDGFIDVSGGPESYFIPYDQWPEIEKTAIGLAQGRILDIGVGAGRVCLHLQENGMECVGIDNSPNAVHVAGMRGVNDAGLISFEQISSLDEKFDTVTMYGNNFGLFGNKEKVGKMLEVLGKITSREAVILAESFDPYRTESIEHLDYQAYNRSMGKMSGQLRIRVRYRKYATPYFEYLIVSQKEMEEMLENTGWNVSGFISGDTPLYIAVLRKKA